MYIKEWPESLINNEIYISKTTPHPIFQDVTCITICFCGIDEIQPYVRENAIN